MGRSFAILVYRPPNQAFAFTGLALVLSGVVLALYTISLALRFQHGRLVQMARGAE